VIDPRERLAQQQADLLGSLVRVDRADPPGFDAEQLRVQRRSLLAKRRRLVERFHPELAGQLGEDFRELFDEYASEHPHLNGRGPAVDAEHFTHWLARRGIIRTRWWQRLVPRSLWR
jgi:hypothetical protein